MDLINQIQSGFSESKGEKKFELNNYRIKSTIYHKYIWKQIIWKDKKKPNLQ